MTKLLHDGNFGVRPFVFLWRMFSNYVWPIAKPADVVLCILSPVSVDLASQVMRLSVWHSHPRHPLISRSLLSAASHHRSGNAVLYTDSCVTKPFGSVLHVLIHLASDKPLPILRKCVPL